MLDEAGAQAKSVDELTPRERVQLWHSPASCGAYTHSSRDVVQPAASEIAPANTVTQATLTTSGRPETDAVRDSAAAAAAERDPYQLLQLVKHRIGI